MGGGNPPLFHAFLESYCSLENPLKKGSPAPDPRCLGKPVRWASASEARKEPPLPLLFCPSPFPPPLCCPPISFAWLPRYVMARPQAPASRLAVLQSLSSQFLHRSIYGSTVCPSAQRAVCVLGARGGLALAVVSSCANRQAAPLCSCPGFVLQLVCISQSRISCQLLPQRPSP